MATRPISIGPTSYPRSECPVQCLGVKSESTSDPDLASAAALD